MAVRPGGEVYVVWQLSRAVAGRMYDASDLRFAWSTDGGRTFSRALTINDDAGGRPSSAWPGAEISPGPVTGL